jgi:hypothetical protein
MKRTVLNALIFASITFIAVKGYGQDYPKYIALPEQEAEPYRREFEKYHYRLKKLGRLLPIRYCDRLVVREDSRSTETKDRVVEVVCYSDRLETLPLPWKELIRAYRQESLKSEYNIKYYRQHPEIECSKMRFSKRHQFLGYSIAFECQALDIRTLRRAMGLSETSPLDRISTNTVFRQAVDILRLVDEDIGGYKFALLKFEDYPKHYHGRDTIMFFKGGTNSLVTGQSVFITIEPATGRLEDLIIDPLTPEVMREILEDEMIKDILYAINL